MKPHPRIRKTIKWTGAAVTVLLMVVWVAGAWFHISWSTGGGYSIGILRGSFWVWYSDFLGKPGLEYGLASTKPYFDLWPVYYKGFYGASILRGWHASVPVWLCAIIALTCSAFAWRLDTLAHRRAKLKLCPKCTYDRTGLLKDARCPECGSVQP